MPKTTRVDTLITAISLMKAGLAKAKTAFEDGNYTIVESALNTAAESHFSTQMALRQSPQNNSELESLKTEIGTLYQQTRALASRLKLVEPIKEMHQDLAKLAKQIEACPDTTNKNGLLQQVKHLQDSWKFIEKQPLPGDVIGNLLEKTGTACDQAEEALKTLTPPSTSHPDHYSLEFDSDTEEQEGVLAGIYARIASFFNEVIALFQQYVSEPVQNAARSTASFFNARSVPTVSDEPDAEEAYSPPALQS